MKRQTISVRAWTEQIKPDKPDKTVPTTVSAKTAKRQRAAYHKRVNSGSRVEPGLVLVFDTETTTDVYQNLLIGSYLIAWVDIRETENGIDTPGTILEQGLFYADDLPETDPDGYKIIEAYARQRGNPFNYVTDGGEINETALKNWANAVLARANLGMPYRPTPGLQFMSGSAFVNDKLYEYGYERVQAGREVKPATIVTANGPFDFSRLAHAVHQTLPQFGRNGFSLRLLPGDDYDRSELTEDLRHAGNVQIVRRGALGNRFGFAHKRQHERDYFVDVLNLGFALTNTRYSLDSLGRAFHPPELGGRFLKSQVSGYGEITDEFIDYMRQDVFATYASYIGELVEVWKHPPTFDETRAYSPATLGKSYVKAMGVVPLLTRQPDFPREILGHAMTTFFGGRAECRVRRVPVPVWYFDFTSMYLTVNTLMNLWSFWIQERVECHDGTERVKEFLGQSDLFNRLFSKESWLEMQAIVLIKANGDILPIRTRFGSANNTIAIARVTSDEPLWYSLPDVIASTILTGKPPEVIKAIDFVSAGNRMNGLKPVRLRGMIGIDPNRQDFFKIVTEQRQAIKLASKGCKCGICEYCRTSESSKVTGNACAYGMNAEFNQEVIEKSQIRLYGTGDEPFTVESERIDKPGEFSFPPLATLITGGARLMLAMLEKSVTDAGGVWVAADTDSMMPVVTRNGEPVQTRYGAIPAISEQTATKIQERFDSLNPYDPTVAPGIHILKREHDKDPRPLYCYAISAKRYALFHLNNDGSIELSSDDIGELRSEDIETLSGDGRKEHGIGAYMSPYNPDDETERGKRGWVTEIWHYLICRELSIPVEEPSFFNLPVMTKVQITTWTGYQLFRKFNEGKPRREQIKEYSFAMSPVISPVAKIMHGLRQIRLITPFERDPSRWRNAEYIDTSNDEGRTYSVTTDVEEAVLTGRILVQTWCDVVREFGRHPEVKFTDTNGHTCGEETRGLLERHSITVGRVDYILKESNRFTTAEIEAGMAYDIRSLRYGSNQTDMLDLVFRKDISIPPVDKEFGPLAKYHSRQWRDSWHGLSRRELLKALQAKGITEINDQAIRHYLETPVSVTSSLKWDRTGKHIRNLAVDVALEEIPEDSRDPSWRYPAMAYRNWQDVILTWRETP